jgi:hypothetical protein
MTAIRSSLAPAGRLSARLVRARTFTHPLQAIVAGLPWFGQTAEEARYRLRNLPHLLRGAFRLVMAWVCGIPHFYGTVQARVLRADGTILDLGVISLRVVTTAGVNFLVDALQGIVEPEILKYHGVGTGATAEASADTALVTESTTALNPDSTRATGSLAEGGSANVFRSVGTVTFDNSAAITEHGLFSQAATGGGTLLDRSVFSAINVIALDSIQFTYDLTLTPGS